MRTLNNRINLYKRTRPPVVRQLIFSLVLGASYLTCFAADQAWIKYFAETDQYFLNNRDVNYKKMRMVAGKLIQNDIDNGSISTENSQAFAQQIAITYAHAMLSANCLRSSEVKVKAPGWIADFLGGNYPNTSNKLLDMSVDIFNFYGDQMDKSRGKLLKTKACNNLLAYADFAVSSSPK